MPSSDLTLADLPAPSKELTLADLPTPTSEPSWYDKMASRASSFATGLKDPITGGAQLLTHSLPKPVVEAGNKLNNWLAQYGLVSEIPKGGLDEQIRQDEAALSARRNAAGVEGMDVSRLAGNILSPANLGIARATPAAVTTLGKLVAGTAQGAASGALAPVTEGDFATEKAKQASLGALTGAVSPILGKGASRVVSPEVSPEVAALKAAGVEMTPGQIAGGALRGIEERLSGYPIVGDIIKSSEKRGIESFDRATLDKALSHVNEKLPKNIPAGHEAIEYARNAIGDKYDTLLPKLGGTIDKGFAQDLGAIRVLGQNLPKERADQLNRILDNEIVSRFTSSGKASGETVKQIESKLGGMAAEMRRSGDYDVRNMGDAIREAQDSLRRMLERNNPQYKGELSKVNSAWRDYLRAERAAGMVGAKEGIFTPAQLKNAAKALDPSKRKAQFASGKAPMQEWAEAGQKVLSPTVPDSGTAGRIAAAMAAMNPGRLGLPLLGGALAAPLYSKLGQQVAQAAMTSRPQGAEALAGLIERNPQAITAGTVPLAELMMATQSP